MADRKQCEFFLVRYVPDTVKDEFVNIGVVLMESGGLFADVRVTRDWKRVLCMGADAHDIEMLEALGADLQARVKGAAADRARWIEKLEDALSNNVQVSSRKACLTEDPAQEIERMAKMYLESRPVARERAEKGRLKIRRAMIEAWDRVGLWGTYVKPDLQAAEFTRAGDPLKLDCFYRNGKFRMFHAMAIDADANAAKSLAWSYEKLAAGIERKLGVAAAMTVVTGDSIEREREEVAFAIETLEQSAIEVARVSEMPRIVERARLELRL